MSKEAIVLAGGLGTRLKHLLDDLPKPMAPIGDKPFLTYLLLCLENEGIERVILSLQGFEVVDHGPGKVGSQESFRENQECFGDSTVLRRFKVKRSSGKPRELREVKTFVRKAENFLQHPKSPYIRFFCKLGHLLVA